VQDAAGVGVELVSVALDQLGVLVLDPSPCACVCPLL
jgi:hypothetical protein